MGEKLIEVEAWTAQFADAQRDWVRVVRAEHAFEQQVVDRWRSKFDEWRTDAAALRAAGQWYSGPTDFMGVLWLGQDEVRNCRVLAWLMDPAGAHGLGDAVLRGVSAAAPLDVVADSADGRVTVSTEQVMGGTRADIVVRSGSGTLVIEAKVNAGESEGQTGGYQERWGESATFLFLTRDGSPPSADDRARWRTLRWIDVAAMIDGALEVGNPNAPGRGVAEGFRDAVRNHLRPPSGAVQPQQSDPDERGGEFGDE